jgi:hypothetical protein
VRLHLGYTQVSDAGCAALAAALDSGALPALVTPRLNDIPASAAAIDAVREAQARSRAAAIATSYTRMRQVWCTARARALANNCGSHTR